MTLLHLLQFVAGLSAASASSYHALWSDFQQTCDRSTPQPLYRFWGSTPHPDKSMLNLLTDPDDRNIAILPKWDPKGKKSLPLADTHVAVRFLGGVSPYADATKDGCVDEGGVWCDLVRRLPDGSLQNRWDLVDSRLSQFADNAVDAMIVLDNVPWAFVNITTEQCQDFGCQYLPPDDPSKFATWVGELATYMKEKFGSAWTSRIRWRLGTEANGPRWSDRGKYFDAYLESYKLTMKRIKEVLPSAQVGTSNLVEVVGSSGDFTPGGPDGFQYKFYEAIGADSSIPLDFISMSWYGGGGHRSGAANFPGSDYIQRTPNGKTGKFELAAMRELAKRMNAPLEVHEWGILDNEQGQATYEPSSVGVAWSAASATTWMCDGLFRLFHWQSQIPQIRNSTGDNRVVRFYETWSWNMAILELFLGGNARFTTYDKVNPSAEIGERGSVALIESIKADVHYIMLAGVGANRYDNYFTFVPVTIDPPGGGDVTIEQYKMSSETSVIEMIIRELSSQPSMFKNPDKPLPADFNHLLTAEGLKYVQRPENLERYWAQNVDNLQAKPYTGEWSRLADGRVSMHPQVDAYSVTVLVVKAAGCNV